MPVAVKWVPTALAGLVLIGCGKRNEPRVAIASVEGMGFPQENARNVLARGGFHPNLDVTDFGSVTVPARQSVEATKLLIADAKLHPYDYTSIRGYTGKLGLPDESKWQTRTLNVDLSQVDSAPEFQDDWNLLGLAHSVRDELHQVGAEFEYKQPFITEIRRVRMEYTDTDGKPQIGYYGAALGGDRLRALNFKFYGWSWDHGAKHQSSGGTF